MSLVNIRAALESAVAGMPGIIPAVDIVSNTAGSSGRPSVFTTAEDHGLPDGISVTIRNHSIFAAASFSVVVTGRRTFTLLNKVTREGVAILAGIAGKVEADLTAWENRPFEVPTRIPYQKVNLIPARPDDITMGRGHRREIGIFQITLCYPIQFGSGDAVIRAELIRSVFPRGETFSNGGVSVHVEGTPEIGPGMIDGEHYVVPVRVFYWAEIFS